MNVCFQIRAFPQKQRQSSANKTPPANEGMSDADVEKKRMM